MSLVARRDNETARVVRAKYRTSNSITRFASTVPKFTSAYYTANMPNENGLSEVGDTTAIQTILTNSVFGTQQAPNVYVVPPGIYRGGSLSYAHSWTTLEGNGHVVISGSDIWTGWTGAGPYVNTLTANNFTDAATHVDDSFKAGHCNMVFSDGVMLTQIPSASTLATGQWQFTTDASDFHIKLFDNPAGHLIEVTMRTTAFAQWNLAGESVSGIQFRHFASKEQSLGAINVGGNTGSTIQNCVFSWFHGLAVFVAGANCTIKNNWFHDIGTSGVNVFNTSGWTFTGNVGWNWVPTWSGYTPSWASALIKVATATGGLASNNVGWNGRQALVWLDIQANTSIIQDNIVWDCANASFFLEISEGNILRRNIAFTTAAWPWGAAECPRIFISTSCLTEVCDNILIITAGTISQAALWIFWDQTRVDKPADPAGSLNIHDNFIWTNQGVFETWNDSSAATGTYTIGVGNASTGQRYWPKNEVANRFYCAGSGSLTFNTLAAWTDPANGNPFLKNAQYAYGWELAEVCRRLGLATF